jgi:hypothetical protein
VAFVVAHSGVQEEPLLFNLVTLVSTFGSLSFFAVLIGILWWRQILLF